MLGRVRWPAAPGSLFLTGLCNATAAWKAAALGTPLALHWQALRPTGLASGWLPGGVRWPAALGSFFFSHLCNAIAA